MLLQRIAQAVDADSDAARSGGDLLRLLKPAHLAPSKKNLLTSQAYLASPAASPASSSASAVAPPAQFELSPALHRALPEGIQLAMAEAECDATMGLFCEIERVWVVVDNLLFLWDYQQPGNAYETYSSKHNDQLIVSVSLCRPKPDFSSSSASSSAQGKPDYLLVLTSFIDVSLVRVDRGPGGAWKMQDTGILCSTDGTLMRHSQGTAQDGRIFLAGEDGSLHELVYETKRTLLHRLGFKRQCFTLECGTAGVGDGTASLTWLVPPVLHKIMASTGLIAAVDPLVQLFVDDARRLLYALTRRSKLLMFSLGSSSGAECRLVAEFDFTKLGAQLDLRAVNLVGVKDLDLKQFDVSSINVVRSLHSSVHLVAVGKNGVRIYFTTCESLSALLSSSSSSSSQRPQAWGKRLTAVSVRAPPDANKLGGVGGFVPATVPQQGSSAAAVLASYTNSRVTLLAGADNTCAVLAVSAHSVSSQQWAVDEGLCETVDVLRLAAADGAQQHTRIYAVEEITHKSPATGEEAVNELVAQYSEPRPTFLVLTNRGIRALVKHRPVEQLQQGLDRITKSAAADEFTKQFFRKFGLDEACCMALHLAASSSSSSTATSHNPLFTDNDWSHNLLTNKAGHFLSSLGYLLPNSSSSSSSSSKLPELKSKLEQDRDSQRATEAALNTYSYTTAASSRPQDTAVAQPSASRAILVSGTSNGTAEAAAAAALLAASPNAVEADTHFSGCFQGLILLLSRLLRPFWNQSLLSPTNKDEFRFTAKQLEGFLAPLRSLQLFMETRHPFHHAVSQLSSSTHRPIKQWTPALVEELRTQQAYALVRRTGEALQLLIEVQSRAPHAALRKQLAQAVDPQLATFAEFVGGDVDAAATEQQLGQRIARQLINNSVQQLKEVEEDDLLQRLGQVSPSFFSTAHFAFLRSRQQFSKLESNVMASNDSRQAMLSKALELAKQSLADETKPDVAVARLTELCLKLQNTDNVFRCVELSALVASKFGEAKQQAYALCFDAIQATASSSGNTPASKRAWDQVLQNSDVSFRYFFYQQWISKQQIPLLFDVVTTLGGGDAASTMERFLRDPALNTYGNDGHDDAHLQLLAKWLVLVGRTQEASETYLALARIDKFPLLKRNPTLSKRYEYLNNALVLSSGGGSSNNAGGLSRELALLKCRMDVYEALRGKTSTSAGEDDDEVLRDLDRLEYCLVGETELLNRFAHKYKLWEECIAIIQAFGRQQPEAIRMVHSLYGALTQPHFKPEFDAPGLVQTVSRLAARFGRDAVVFPLNDLVVSLERTKLARFGDGENEDEEEEDEAEEDEESKPKFYWLAEAVLETGVVPPETAFVAYVRYCQSACETRAQFADGVRALLYIVEQWQAQAGADLASKVRGPAAALRDARDLPGGVEAVLRGLIDQLPSAGGARGELETKLANLRLDELVRAHAGSSSSSSSLLLLQ